MDKLASPFLSYNEEGIHQPQDANMIRKGLDSVLKVKEIQNKSLPVCHVESPKQIQEKP